jgi:hypothetical protein
VEAGRVRCALPVTPAVQNRYGTLHGGCIGARRGVHAASCFAPFIALTHARTRVVSAQRR